MKLLQEFAATGSRIARHLASGQIRRSQNALRVQRIVAEKLVHRTVQVVGAALGDDVYNAAHGASCLRPEICVDDAELLHRLLRRRGFLNARGSGHIVGAVDRHKVVVDILAGERKFGHWFDDDVGAARSGIANRDAGRQ